MAGRRSSTVRYPGSSDTTDCHEDKANCYLFGNKLHVIDDVDNDGDSGGGDDDGDDDDGENNTVGALVAEWGKDSTDHVDPFHFEVNWIFAHQGL